MNNTVTQITAFQICVIRDVVASSWMVYYLEIFSSWERKKQATSQRWPIKGTSKQPPLLHMSDPFSRPSSNNVHVSQYFVFFIFHVAWKITASYPHEFHFQAWKRISCVSCFFYIFCECIWILDAESYCHPVLHRKLQAIIFRLWTVIFQYRIFSLWFGYQA